MSSTASQYVPGQAAQWNSNPAVSAQSCSKKYSSVTNTTTKLHNNQLVFVVHHFIFSMPHTVVCDVVKQAVK